jgi:hypothetical protein
MVLQVSFELLLNTDQHSQNGGVIGGISFAEFVDQDGWQDGGANDPGGANQCYYDLGLHGCPSSAALPGVLCRLQHI